MISKQHQIDKLLEKLKERDEEISNLKSQIRNLQLEKEYLKESISTCTKQMKLYDKVGRLP